MKMAKWPVLIIFFLVFGNFLVRAFRPAAPVEQEPKKEIPQLFISLENVTLEQLNNGAKKIKYDGNEATFLVEGERFDFSNVQIKGRGNSTWGRNKNPYQIKFDSKVDLFGMGKAKNWILLANYYDASFLRNDLAYFLSDLLFEKNKMIPGEFVELYIDGDYRGLYYLTHKAEINRSVVNLKDEMGILVELDDLWEKENCVFAENGACLVLKDTVSDDEEKTTLAMENFVENFDKLTAAAEQGDWKKVLELAEIDSFVEYYILSEFSLNPDAFFSSHFYYKDGLGDKIHVGPAWDFDLAFGSIIGNEMQREKLCNPSTKMTDQNQNEEDQMNSLFRDLVELPEFQEKVKEKVEKVLIANEEKILERIDSQIEKIKDAAVRNVGRWGEASCEWAAASLRQWVVERMKFFKEEFSDSGQLELKPN